MAKTLTFPAGSILKPSLPKYPAPRGAGIRYLPQISNTSKEGCSAIATTLILFMKLGTPI
jgi:hypothetical protein